MFLIVKVSIETNCFTEALYIIHELVRNIIFVKKKELVSIFYSPNILWES